MQAIVITPVKDALEATLETIQAISEANGNYEYWVFNDYSTDETKKALENASSSKGFNLVNLEEITSNPSPNYKTVLQVAQKKALNAGVPLIIVESDVKVNRDTLAQLLQFAQEYPNAGLVGAITHDAAGKVNFPYLKFKQLKSMEPTKTNRSLSFCCTLINNNFLEKYDFTDLDNSKDWYDTHISQKAVELGFENFILPYLPVWHRPHASRPWKQLKYKNPILYYFRKWFLGKDKI
ncbi:glycosyltransferase family A protein [Cyclobacterium marinum]|uniref:Glycosyl transferase family 2 n=1 Tax=Cyclobacterium marinum (strain ATCC 25205 / DSM 745 / LMG 13164 / NCIMB 1802) TaxID=880070 RepID=G0J3T1_CYCMS|nr:glycosyltransferase family 2 protein [Cyclobacterium marinum]AEL25905.1 glycosyl transferase family 2 [Cyclobacterium marinum DSM 745]